MMSWQLLASLPVPSRSLTSELTWLSSSFSRRGRVQEAVTLAIAVAVKSDWIRWPCGNGDEGDPRSAESPLWKALLTFAWNRTSQRPDSFATQHCRSGALPKDPSDWTEEESLTFCQLWSGKWTGQRPHEWKSELQVHHSVKCISWAVGCFIV